MSLTDPAIRTAAGLDPSLESTLTAQDAAIHEIPEFATEFTSSCFPKFAGPVVIRYGNVGDALAIERLMGPQPGFVAEAIASMQVLISKAPASWYRVPEGGIKPVLSLQEMPDLEGILDLYRAYSKWRADFRSVREKQ